VSRFEKVIIASVPDAAGNKVASELLDALQRSKVGRLVLPAGVDCNDLDRDDLASRIAAVRSTL
jgi:predicted nuclease with TOPRIM domain